MTTSLGANQGKCHYKSIHGYLHNFRSWQEESGTLLGDEIFLAKT